MGGATGGGLIDRLDGEVGVRAQLDSGAPEGAGVAANAPLEPPASLGKLTIATGLTGGGQVPEQVGDVLHVADGKPKSLVPLQEAIHHGAPQPPNPNPTPFGRGPRVKVMRSK